MTGFNHGMTGAVIALTVKQPLIAVPLSFLSHFVQDMLPHWNYGVGRDSTDQPKFFTRRFNLFLIVDFVSSLLLMAILGLLFPSDKWLIWSCMIAAAIPDLMWAYYRLYLEHIKQKQLHYNLFARFHKSIQWSQTSKGLWFEAAWALVLIGFIALRYWQIIYSPQ